MDGLLWSDFVELFGFAILAALVAGAICPLVGCFLLVRRTGFYGIALPQFAAAGIAFGFVAVPWIEGFLPALGVDVNALTSGTHAALNYHLFWALLFTFGGLIALVLVGKGRGTEAGRIAAAFAIASALTFLFAHSAPTGEYFVHELLRGEILAIGLHEFDTLAVVLGFVLVGVLVFQRDLVLVSYDPESARVLGKRVRGYEVGLQVLTGATVATGVMTVGPVVLFGLLVLPPLAARTAARSMRSFLITSSALGFVAAAGGVTLAFLLDWPLGPAVVAASTLELPLTWIWSRARRS